MTATTQLPGSSAPVQRAAPSGRAGFTGALRSEFTKIRSVRSTPGTLIALVVVTIGIGTLACVGAVSRGADHGSFFDATQRSLAGLILGQLIITVLGAPTVTSEYSTGMIRTALTVQPRLGGTRRWVCWRVWCSSWSARRPAGLPGSCRSSSARPTCSPRPQRHAG